MRRVRNRTLSRLSHIFAFNAVSRTYPHTQSFFALFSHNLELSAQYWTISSVKTKNLSKNWAVFRHLGRCKTKDGFSLDTCMLLLIITGIIINYDTCHY